MATATTTTPVSEVEKTVSILAKIVYPAALAASISIWFLAIRAPLWLDETLAYWQVSGGFAKIWSRSALMPSSIGYLYTLWLAKSTLGSSEIALKIPSTLAVLGAVYFLFRAAREFYDQETAYLACIFFALTNNVIFAATDARPYAFALLASNIAIFAFVRWMMGRRMGRAILFGAAAAGVLYFHFLFGAILPVFAIYYLAARRGSIKEDWRQLAALVAAFTLCSLPLIYRIASLYQSKGTHVVPAAPHPVWTTLRILAPAQLLIGFLIAVFLAALVRKIKLPRRENFPASLFGVLLALVPAGVLVAVSATSTVHLVISRYLTVIACGSALMWALLTMHIDSPVLRKLFCVALVAATVIETYGSPLSRLHEANFKDAHAFINANVAKDKGEVPILVCSAFVESDYQLTASDGSGENPLLSQMDYYPIDAPVTLLPMDLNDESIRIGSETVAAAAQRHQRFLVVASPLSYPTVEWLIKSTRDRFTPQLIAEFDKAIVIVEFRPIATND